MGIRERERERTFSVFGSFRQRWRIEDIRKAAQAPIVIIPRSTLETPLYLKAVDPVAFGRFSVKLRAPETLWFAISSESTSH